MDVMRQAPDKFYDLAIVDPPYGIGEHGGKVRFGPRSIAEGFTKPKSYAKKSWDSEPPTAEYFEELFRVSNNQIIWGGNYMTNNLRPSPCWIIWDKKYANDGSDFADCEMAWGSFKTAARIFRKPWIGFGTINSGETRIHPTQKPVALYEWLLRKYAQPGQLILDTHMGSGSIAIACNNVGHPLTACEIDKEYFSAAVERIGRELKQQTFAMTPNAPHEPRRE
jgi:site-specific DNA-methyltransferase (adenine-specific)